MSSISRLVSSARSHTCSDHAHSFESCMHLVHRHFRATKQFGFSLPHAALKALVSFVQFRLHQASRQSVALTCVRARVWSLFFPVGIAQLNNMGGPIPVLCFFHVRDRVRSCISCCEMCVTESLCCAQESCCPQCEIVFPDPSLELPGGAWQLILLGK